MKKKIGSVILFLTALAGSFAGAWLYGVLCPPEVPDLQVTIKNMEAVQSGVAGVLQKARPAMVRISPEKNGQKAWFPGFLIRQDGYLATHLHAVPREGNILVTTADNKLHTAEFTGADPATGVAVLKISGTGHPVFHFADTVQTGMWTILPGYAADGSLTVSAAILSGTGQDWIRTDVVPRQGNAGGPVLDLRGEILGMNVPPEKDGIHTALPGRILRTISAELIARGTIERPWLGIFVSSLPPDAPEQGLLIHHVAPHSPAADSLDAGDHLLKVNGQRLTTPGDLQKILCINGIGKELFLEIRRQGRSLSGSLIPGKSPANWFRKVRLDSREPVSPM